MMMLSFIFVGFARIQATNRVVCLGDSLATTLKLPLQAALGDKFEVDAIVNRSSIFAEEGMKGALQQRPNTVLLCVGSDSVMGDGWMNVRDQFVPSVESTIERLRRSDTHPKVFLCLPPPVNLTAGDSRKVLLESQVLPLLKQAARETDCPIIDFESALKDRQDLVNGLLPDNVGAEVLADTVSDAINTGRKADWKIVYADSEESDEGPARNAIDGDFDTYWHTNYSTTQEKYPHELQVDTGFVRTIGGFSYLPRQDGTNGRVARYEFYVSLDGKDWGAPVAKGTFKAGGELSKISFSKPAKCRYFRFRALSEEQGQIWASVAELDILKFYPKRP